MKSKGLQRLRWYCQVCEKHAMPASESHLRQMLVVGEHAGKHITNFSQQFSVGIRRSSVSFGTKRVRANQVYQEYISDKSHLHMNSTRWVTLTEFVKHLGRSGIARVDETEKGWFLAWIDSSPKALAKAEASLKKDRATTSDEQRERTLIAEQIERATAESAGASTSSSSTPPVEEGLKRDEGAEKVVLSFSAKPAPAAAPSAAAPTLAFKANPLKLANPLKANPLKRPNVFKTAPSTSSSAPDNDKKRPASSMTAAERLIIEDQERKRRRMG
ncbi:domain of Kin17 curved DNA-binding protein-domain-containing protein [Mycena metata]|uniref:Domain of Kin17 curved DNA-binding protein-domain-containing protein n=1 Tax=Mycena metata TaxID=1033252 RepID=A0AAD7H463_9AGAR|nr:domain of Kin17 curved DNA-binding protein-domain-containing protein [Mycena metata]